MSPAARAGVAAGVAALAAAIFALARMMGAVSAEISTPFDMSSVGARAIAALAQRVVSARDYRRTAAF